MQVRAAHAAAKVPVAHLALAAFVLAALITPDAAGAQASTIYACASTRDGTLRLVPSSDLCKAGRETAVSWNAVGPQGPPGPEGAPGPQGDPGQPAAPGVTFYLYDATGTRVGPVGGHGTVYLESIGASVTIIEGSGLLNQPVKSQPVFFDEAGCQGNAFVQFAHDLLGNGPSGAQRYFVGHAPRATVSFGSILGATTGECREYLETDGAFPATEVTLEDFGIPIPLPAPLYIAP